MSRVRSGCRPGHLRPLRHRARRSAALVSEDPDSFLAAGSQDERTRRADAGTRPCPGAGQAGSVVLRTPIHAAQAGVEIRPVAAWGDFVLGDEATRPTTVTRRSVGMAANAAGNVLHRCADVIAPHQDVAVPLIQLMLVPAAAGPSTAPPRVTSGVAICELESMSLSDGNCGGCESRRIEYGEGGIGAIRSAGHSAGTE